MTTPRDKALQLLRDVEEKAKKAEGVLDVAWFQSRAELARLGHTHTEDMDFILAMSPTTALKMKKALDLAISTLEIECFCWEPDNITCEPCEALDQIFELLGEEK